MLCWRPSGGPGGVTRAIDRGTALVADRGTPGKRESLSQCRRLRQRIAVRLTPLRTPDNITPSPDMARARGARRSHGEENVPAEQRPAQEEAWIPRAHEDSQGTPRAEAPSGQGSEEIDGLARSGAERFTPADRLQRRREFEAVYARGVRIPGRRFTMLLLPNDAGRCRLGLTFSRKVGNSVARNRARRRIREIFRRRRHLATLPVDIVVHARPGIGDASLLELQQEFDGGLARFEARRKREG